MITDIRRLMCTLHSLFRRRHMTSFDLRVLKWIFYVITISLLLYIFIYELRSFLHIRDVFLSQHEQAKEKYAIVLDGGSTGTRIYVFRFFHYSNSNITLEDSIAIKTKPGLANFAVQPNRAVQNITYLLDWAKENVPREKWGETPITLKVTAALRALPISLSSSLLDEIDEILQASPFHCQNKCVSLLEANDEGIYGWFTLNYLLGRLNTLHQTAAYIETGGGSFQVTFLLGDQHALKLSKTINSSFPIISQKPLTMYTRSYLGMGFLSARFSFLHASNDNLDLKKRMRKNAFVNSCIQPHHAGYLQYNNVEYLVIGQKNKNFSYEYCYQKIVDFLGNKVERVEELSKRDVYVSGINPALLQPIRKEGDCYTIEAFVNVCKRYCSVKIPYATFLCFDCTYTSAFLIYGLGLDVKKEIKILNKIDGFQIGWCLGVALNMIL